MMPNLIWSIIHLAPISVYCYNLLDHTLLYVFIAASFIPLFLPNAFLDKIQIGRTVQTYRRLGVNIVNQVTQNGDIINRLIRKKYPDYKAVVYQRASVHKLLQQTYAYEKFHLVMFVFFCLVTVHAIVQQHYGWAVILSLSNLLYNIYPNLLQQYIRLRLRTYKKKLESN